MGCSQSKNNNNDEISEYNSVIDDSQSLKSFKTDNCENNCDDKLKIKIVSIMKNKGHLVMIKGSTRTIHNNPISGREKSNSTIISPINKNKNNFEFIKPTRENCISDDNDDIINLLENETIDKIKKVKSESDIDKNLSKRIDSHN